MRNDVANVGGFIGYARVSTHDKQDVSLQVDALRSAGCEVIHEERASGGRRDRPVLLTVLDGLRPGDVLTVWKLDRLTRSLSDMLWLFERIHAAGAGFRSLTEAIDTTTPAGQMLAHMLGAFAQFERAMITERVRAGVQAAKARGVQLGRKPKLGYHQQQEAKRLIVAGQSQASVARLLDVDASTICRLVARAGA